MNDDINKNAVCDLCGHNSFNTLYYTDIQEEDCETLFKDRAYDWRILKCSVCGLVATSPKLDNNINCEYYNAHLKPLINKKETFCEKYAYSIYYALTRRLPRKKGKILDVGCGIGRYLVYLRSRGWYVEGIEPAYAMYKIAVDYYSLKAFNGFIEDYNASEKYYDIITLFQTLEHVSSPSSVLSVCKKLLKDDGLIIIGNQPNFKSFDQRIFKSKDRTLGVPYHIYHFDEKTMKKLCDKLGLKLEKVEYELWVPTQISYNLISLFSEWLRIRLGVRLKLIICLILFPFLFPIYILLKYTKTSLTCIYYIRKIPY